MKFRKKPAFIFLMLALSLSFLVKGQDVRLSQPFTNILNLNPAMMGGNGDLSAMLNHRSQWASVNSGYKTYNLNVLYPYFLKNGNSKLDFGLGVRKRTQGAFDNLDAGLSVGYQLKLNDAGHYLSAAIQASYNQSSLDVSSLTFDDQYVQGAFSSGNMTTDNIANNKISYLNSAVGLMWYFSPDSGNGNLHAYFGVSVFNLNKPNESYTNSNSPLPIRQSYQTGIKIVTEGKVDFSPHLIYQSQGGSEELAAGLYVDYLINDDMTATLGGWYRKDNSTAVIVGFRWTDFALGYSYDLLTSNLNSSVKGLTTHEISLSYRLNMAARKGVNFMPLAIGRY